VRPHLLLDVETAPIENAALFIDASDIEAPDNYKNKEAIDGFINRELVKRLGKAAVDIDLARIVALGYMAHDEREPVVHTCRNEEEEARALQALWTTLRVPAFIEFDYKRNMPPPPIDGHLPRIVTFNGHRFDLPLLMRRSDYLNVEYPNIVIDRYRSPHLDLMLWLTFRGELKPKSLAWYARRFGVVNDEPEIDGKMIPALAAENTPEAWSKIVAHNRADILMLLDLCVRLKLLPKPEPAPVVDVEF
jgi:hypothetical protein